MTTMQYRVRYLADNPEGFSIAIVETDSDFTEESDGLTFRNGGEVVARFESWMAVEPIENAGSN